MKNKKIVINIILIVTAVVLAVFGVYLLKRAKFYENNGVKTEAEITSIVVERTSKGEKRHTAIVQFQVDGKTYGGELDYYDSSMREGGKTPVYYLPDDPNDFHSAELNYLPSIVFFIAAAVVTVVVVVRFVRKPTASQESKTSDKYKNS